jgi:hypothetical protein
MLAGDESVVEPWLLGWCGVIVRVGGGADSMPYCSVGERGVMVESRFGGWTH